jgi:biotin carboxyl carrier protein
MSLYTVRIDDREYKVDISGSRSTVNGKVVKTRIVPLNQSGLHMLQRGKKVLELFLNVQEGENDTFEMLMHGGHRIITRIDNRKRVEAMNRSGEKMPVSLAAPMHGLVVDVLVKAGDKVRKDQTLVVLESMKMQMQLRAPCPGTVSRVRVKSGQQIEKGAIMIEFGHQKKEQK